MKKTISHGKYIIHKTGLVLLLMYISFQDIFPQTTLYYNGNIFTSDTANPIISYFIVKNGKISVTGTNLDPDSITYFDNRVNLNGKTIIAHEPFKNKFVLTNKLSTFIGTSPRTTDKYLCYSQ